MRKLFFIRGLFTQRRLSFAMTAVLLHGMHAEEPKPVEGAATTTVQRPTLERYAKLWTESLFTSERSAASAASFAENLTLAGVYEVDGRAIAVVVDKQSSIVTEVDSRPVANQKLRLVRIEKGDSSEKDRVLLQNGAITGWVSFAETTAGATAAPAPAPAMAVPATVPTSTIPRALPAIQNVDLAKPAADAPIPLNSVPDIRTSP